MAKKFGPHMYEYKLGQRNYSFDTQVDQIVANTKEKLLFVVKDSLDNLIEEIQTPVAKDGKMHVDTGFLRHSAVASVNEIPSGEVRGRRRRKGEIGVLEEYSGDRAGPIGVKISQVEIGDIFYFGWSANYAKIREAYDGFLEAGLMNWQKHVDNAINKLKR